jgi:acyl-CoA synthetase (AMP-forming)/AMP-acid ligase II
MSERTPPASIRTIQTLIETKAKKHGERTYLRYKDRQLSYEALHRKTNIIANQLMTRGVEPGDHVCLFLYNSIEYLLSYFALAKLGATVVPIDTRFTGETLSYVISETEAETVFIDEKTRADYEEIRDDLTIITTEYFVSTNEDESPYRPFDALLDGKPEAPGVEIAEDDTLAIIFVQPYPSDKPKGVMLPHYAYIHGGWVMSQNHFDYSPEDTIFTTLPLHGILPIQLGAMATLVAGAEFVIEDPFDPDLFWNQVDSYQATIFLYLGRTLSVLYNEADNSEYQTNSLENAIGHGFGFGSVADDKLINNVEDRFDITVYEGYSLTETASIGTFNFPGERMIGSCGKSLPSAEVAIVDQQDRFLEPGESGEIVVRPTRQNTMFQGYYNEPEMTVEACQNQWIHTGGVGRLDQEGFLYFVANEINAIYRGQTVGRISALEIESVINAHPGVEISAVVGVKNNTGKEDIMATVVPSGDQDLDPIEVCQHCELQLPYLKIPRYIDIQQELPTNPSGKVAKNELRDSVIDAWDRESGYELSR